MLAIAIVTVFAHVMHLNERKCRRLTKIPFWKVFIVEDLRIRFQQHLLLSRLATRWCDALNSFRHLSHLSVLPKESNTGTPQPPDTRLRKAQRDVSKRVMQKCVHWQVEQVTQDPKNQTARQAYYTVCCEQAPDVEL